MPRPTSYADLDGPLSAQEFIQLQINADSGNIAAITALPRGCPRNVWVYEHLRQFIAQLNALIALLARGGEGDQAAPEDACTPQSCSSMTCTDKWGYLCAAHGATPQQCSALDYCSHLLASLTTALCNPVAFPHRHKFPDKSAEQFDGMARRLYRVFGHAFHHHRRVFDSFESSTHVTARFLHFVQEFKIMSPAAFVPPIDLSPPVPQADGHG